MYTTAINDKVIMSQASSCEASGVIGSEKRRKP